MPLWNHCAICGKRIEVGEPCIGIEKKNTEIVGDSICFDCVKIENINGLDKTVSITDLLARAEAAEDRAEKAEKCITEIEEALKFQRYSASMFFISEYRGQKEE